MVSVGLITTKNLILRIDATTTHFFAIAERMQRV